MTSRQDREVEQDERDATARESQRQADKDLCDALDRSERQRIAALEAKQKRGFMAWVRGLFGR